MTPADLALKALAEQAQNAINNLGLNQELATGKALSAYNSPNRILALLARIAELESDIEAAWTNLRSVMDSRDKARAAGYAAGQETMKTRCLRMAQSDPYVRDSIRALPVEREASDEPEQ